MWVRFLQKLRNANNPLAISSGRSSMTHWKYDFTLTVFCCGSFTQTVNRVMVACGAIDESAVVTLAPVFSPIFPFHLQQWNGASVSRIISVERWRY